MTPRNQAPAGARRPLSVAIIAKNEAARIGDCLASVAWADDIVVVDSGSTDATCDIARRYTQKVHSLPWRGFGAQKQAAVDLAAHDWVLSVDCDERITPELAAEIRQLLAAEAPLDAYSIPRRTFLGSREIRHCGWYPDRTVRLFDRRRARFSDSLVHEQVLASGPVGKCREHMLHYSFTGLEHLLEKMNRYTDLSARQMYEEGRRCSVFDLAARPLAAFVKTYVLRAGILDGVDGLTIAATSTLSTFAKYAKLRELERKAAAARAATRGTSTVK
jgi:glycosyltransferase involved in cell wall biosynthesis